MTAQNTTVTLAAQTMTELTDADVSAIRVQNQSAYDLFVMAAPNATPPSDTLGGILLYPGDTLAADRALSDLFPGVTAGYRVFVYSANAAAVSYSNA